MAFSELQFSQFRFTVQAIEDIHLPEFSGTTFRGAFGHSLKSVACLRPGKNCNPCSHPQVCAYGYVFETPRPIKSDIMRKYTYIPHPFVIVPPLEKKQIYKKGESFSFGLTLIGRAISFLPYFVYTFEKLGEMGLGKKSHITSGRFHLLYISQRNRRVYENGILKADYIIELGQEFWKDKSESSSVSITFLTPVKIIFRGKITKRLEFHILLRNLLRRLALLLYFHTEKKPEIDFHRIIEESRKIQCTEHRLKLVKFKRYSTRQKQKIPMQGLTGKVIYKGNLSPFLPYLRLGEILHIGKNTSFGMGRYKLEYNRNIL